MQESNPPECLRVREAVSHSGVRQVAGANIHPLGGRNHRADVLVGIRPPPPLRLDTHNSICDKSKVSVPACGSDPSSLGMPSTR